MRAIPTRPFGFATAILVLLAALANCDGGDPQSGASTTTLAATDSTPGADVMDAGNSDADADAEPTLAPPPERTCPADMVRVARSFCVDRFESALVDKATGQSLSAFYPPSKRLVLMVERIWEKERFTMGDAEDQAVPMPFLPKWEKQADFEPRAVSKRGVLPNGYTTGKLSELACKNAGKRLCKLEEWRTACRGEANLPFPYGDKYVQGKCNIFREAHPAMELHNDASIGHTDPRLNQVKSKGKALLRNTGETTTCGSVWEGEAIYDMVGNLDEWIDDPEGTFVGGFFSRSKKDGCASIITGHVYEYFDYSTGTRCCSDLKEPN